MQAGAQNYSDLLKKKVHTMGVVCFFQNWYFSMLYFSACEKATALVFKWDDRGCPAVCFEYKTASERCLVAEI